jgi:CDGSH-type Zn-finger protein
MSSPAVARPKPCLVNVKAGRTYFWCRCGRSQKQPFCDGSHQGSDFSPMEFAAAADDELLLCGCKRTRNGPFCDGAHTNLPGGSPLDDPDSPDNRRTPVVTERDGALHSLEATSAGGIDVVGVICPGDNPSINYYD